MSGSGEHEDGKRIGPPALPKNYSKPLAPVTPAERVTSLDVLRGCALLGILIANMLYFSQPTEPDGSRDGLWFGPLDRLADWTSAFLIEGKFYPLFSFLFGLGFSIQMDRASARGLDFKVIYRRRLFILMGFGFAHGILLWDGDVLLPYAVCGFALLLFRNRKPLTILVWSAAFIILPSLLILAVGLLLLMFSGNHEFTRAMEESMTEDARTTRELIRAYVTGGYGDAVTYRIRELPLTILVMMIFAPAFLGLFLIGMLAGRNRMIENVTAHRRSLVRILMVCGAFGLTGNFLGAWLMTSGAASGNHGPMLIGTGLISIFGPVLTAAYVAGIVLLIECQPSLAILPSIASVGQMALTNYLAQSAVATTIFYGYGLGLGGSVGRLGTIGIALLIYAVQVLFSVFWLNRFHYGTAEWLWRSLTYGTRQPFRRWRSSLAPPP